jgi:dihydrolipoamide dehydrogenase
MAGNSRAKTNHEPDGFVKVIADANTDRVLGVWIIASVAGTMIAQAAQAMEFGRDVRGYCIHLPRTSDAQRSDQGSGDGGDGQADPHLAHARDRQ